MFQSRSEFLTNVISLAKGMSVAQLAPLLATPILTRLYTPSDFGLVSIFISLLSISSIIATGRYELAITLPKSQEESYRLIKISSVLSLIFSLCIFIIIFFYNNAIANLFDAGSIASWLFLLPPFIYISSLSRTYYFYSIRSKLFKHISNSKFWIVLLRS